MNQRPRKNHSKQSQSSLTRRNASVSQESNRLYLKILVNLDNPYEEAISENNQIKEQHETVKLLNEKRRIVQQKHLKR